MSHRFSVSFEIVTPESAEYGDAEERGWIMERGSLREAVEALFGTRTSLVGGIVYCEASDSDARGARWFRVGNAMEFETGATEERALHFPGNVTPASRARLCALLSA